MYQSVRYMYYYLIALITILSACQEPLIDEKYVAKLAKDIIFLSGKVSVQKLSGGFGTTKNFLVTNGLKKYVIRFNQNKSKKDRTLEVYNFKIASKEGYGPRIYFADSSQGIIIMEYFSGKSISDLTVAQYFAEKTDSGQDLDSDNFYILLAQLLKKIHHGQPFKGYGDHIFEPIYKKLKLVNNEYRNCFSIARIEHIVKIIHHILLPHLTNNTPCHNDLNKGNLILVKNEFKAIDYEGAGQGDPFCDIAMIAAAFYCKPKHEKVLLTKYLEREPFKEEQAKFYLIKQVIWIKWFLDDLVRLPPETIQQSEQIETIPIMNLACDIIEGKIDLNKPNNQLKLLKARLNQIFENCESKYFYNALDILKYSKS